MMTRKEVFEKVKTHLLKQGKRSIEINPYSCRYYHNGLKCAIGCLIPEEHYSNQMEGHSIETLAQRMSLKDLSRILDFDLSDRDNIRFLACLQHIHDRREPDQWTKELQRFELELNQDNISK